MIEEKSLQWRADLSNIMESHFSIKPIEGIVCVNLDQALSTLKVPCGVSCMDGCFNTGSNTSTGLKTASSFLNVGLEDGHDRYTR